jgi:hypothetical protein
MQNSFIWAIKCNFIDHSDALRIVQQYVARYVNQAGRRSGSIAVLNLCMLMVSHFELKKIMWS